MRTFPAFLRVFTDSCLFQLDLAISLADSVSDLSRNLTEIFNLKQAKMKASWKWMKEKVKK